MAPTESYDVTGKNTRTSSSATDHRSSEEIRRDIERQRDELDVTTEVLQHKLAPRELAEQLWNDVRTRVGGGAGDVVDVVKRHPLPLGLIGAGIAWWIYETSTGHSLSFGNGDSYDDEDYGVGSSSTGSYGLGASGLSGSAVYGTGTDYDSGGEYGEGSEGWRQRSMQVAQRSTERLRSGAHSARQGFSEAIDRNPLALGAACFSLGILAGIAVPSTRWEDRTMGDASKKVSRKAKHAAADAAVRVAETAAEGAERLKEEAELAATRLEHQDPSRRGQSGSSAREPGSSGGTAGGVSSGTGASASKTATGASGAGRTGTGSVGTSGTGAGTTGTGSSSAGTPSSEARGARPGSEASDGPDPWDANNPGRRRS